MTYNDGKSEIRRPAYSEIAVGLATVNRISVVNYLRENLKNVRTIEILDTLYFRSESDYIQYISR